MYVDSTETQYRHQLSRKQVERKIKELRDSAIKMTHTSWKLPTLSMVVKLPQSKTIDEFIRHYIEDRNEIKNIERRAKARLKQGFETGEMKRRSK